MTDLRLPIEQTPTSRQGKSLQSGYISAARGLATSIADIDRPADYAKVLNNLQMRAKRGIWKSSGIGWTRQRSTAFNGGAAFKDYAVFFDSSGNRTLCWQVGSKVQSYNIGTSTETDIITGLSTTARPCMRNFSPSTSTASPILIYCNGNIEPRKITSTSAESALLFNSPGVWPGTFLTKTYSKPKFCEPFGDRMAYAGFDGTAVAFSVLISNLGDAQVFTQSGPVVATDAVAFTYPAILGPIRGLRSYKIANETNDEILLGGCTNGFFMITGSNATNYAMKILTREYGLLSNRGWVQRDNDLIFPATDGFRTLGGLISNSNLISNTLSFLIKDLYNLIDFANAEEIISVHSPRTQEIQFWVPLTGDGAQNKHAFILNYNNDETGPNGTVPIWSTKDGTSVAAMVNFEGQVYGGGYDGLLQTHYSGNLYDTTPITFSIVPSLVGLGPGQLHSSYKAVVICDGNDQKFDFKPYLYERIPDTGEIARVPGEPPSMTLNSPVSGATTLGAWELGVDAFPADHIKTLDAEFGGNGIYEEYEIVSGSSDANLDFSRILWIISGGGLNR